MRGRTPGKRMAGVRILNRNGGSPSMTALSIRNIFRLIDCLPVLYVVGLVTCLLTANRVRIGDMAAGTLLVLDDAAAEKSLTRIETLAAGSRLPLDTLELVDQILERWESLDKDSRARIARSLLGRINATNQTAALANLNDAELHARLQALLSERDGVAGHV
jgi:RDD family